MNSQSTTKPSMSLVFLGTGSAFSLEYFQSNAVLEIGSKKLLIDAGGDVRRSLKASGIGLTDLDAVYVTHLHSDHWGGAEFLAYASYFNPAFVENGTRRRLKLFTHPRVQGGLFNSLKDSTVLQAKTAVLEDFFDLQACGESFEWQGVKFTLVKTTHVLDDGEPMPCFGLTWQTPDGQTVWFSADALLDAQQPLFDAADVVFHDCETGFRTGVHAHYTELKSLPAEVKKKITLYHYNDGSKEACTEAGFAGWAQQGVWINL
jgi:ribonuclease BN (tRNA processing enzyme)